MSATVIMPQLGETVAEGKILTWFKTIGDEVKSGDNLFEVETDKVTIEVQAIASGKLREIRVGAGSVAKVGAVVAVIGGEVVASTSGPTLARSPEVKPQRVIGSTSSIGDPGTQRPVFDEVTTPLSNFGAVKAAEGVRLTPLARRLVAQNALSLTAIVSDARRRGVTKIGEKDVRAALDTRAASPAPGAAAAPPTAAAASPASSDFVTLNTMRLKTGERLAENWRTIPHVFQAIDVDFTGIDRVRRQHKEAFQSANGFPLTYLPFIARATCLAIQSFPQINAKLDGNSLILSRDIHLGIAVDLSHNGLIVPVIRHAGDFTLAGLAKAMRRQIEKARAGKLTTDDLSGGTYTISNNGAYGTAFTSPIINAPQVAILSTDAIRPKPAVVSTPEGDFVAPRLVGMVGQSFDHRAFDGAYSAAFLSRLKQVLENRKWAEELA